MYVSIYRYLDLTVGGIMSVLIYMYGGLTAGEIIQIIVSLTSTPHTQSVSIYRYAGLTAGGICLCGTGLPATLVSPAFCSQTCPGKPVDKCGGLATERDVSVYSVQETVSGFAISAPSK